MKPLHHPLVPAGAGHRTPATLLALDERDKYLVEASKFFRSPSDREVARQLRGALIIYRAGAWRRDYAEALCPVRYAGTAKAALWRTLKSRDYVPGDRTIRAALAQSRIPTGVEFGDPAIRCPPSDG
jgi:hypothetical protein